MMYFEISSKSLSSLELETDLAALKNLLNQGHPILVVKKNFLTSSEELIELQNRLAHKLGELLPQNSEGERNVLVFNRDSNQTVLTGARFHQTRDGDYFHTDNANSPLKWDYVMLGCLSNGLSGGESILVDGLKVYELLKNHHPKILNELEQPFQWEERGLSKNIFSAPILSYDDSGRPHFRYLRPYMESAHIKAGIPLSLNQVEALNILENLFKDPQNQFRFKLEVGEILITKDALVPHTRSCFVDDERALDYSQWKKEKSAPLKRTLNRIWVRKLN